jgi:hypothetical protein
VQERDADCSATNPVHPPINLHDKRDTKQIKV